jgi:hypothetical protein
MKLLPSRPSQAAVVPVGNGKAFFLSEWPRDSFECVRDFGIFCFRYSSAMQPLIQRLPDDKVEEWLIVDPNAEERYSQWASINKARQGDPIQILSDLLGSALPKWIHANAWNEFVLADQRANLS